MWKKFSSIKNMPAGIWDSLVARGDVCLDSRLLAVAERTFKDNTFHYYAKFNGHDILAVLMVMAGDDTPFYGIEGLERMRLRTFTAGTPETSGLHFWFDPGAMSAERFFSEAEGLMKCAADGAEALVFSDFSERDTHSFSGSGYMEIDMLPVSSLEIPEGAASLEGYISTLKYKYRYQIAQYRGAVAGDRYKFTAVTDYLPIMDELYPLYVEVVERSAEYAAPPYPRDYFMAVKEEFGADAVMMTVTDTETGKCLGFMLLLYTQSSCVHQYIGFRRIDDLFLWHNLTIESIGDAIRRNVRKINMGVTNSSAKHKFGAVTRSNFSYAKLIKPLGQGR